MISSLIHLTVFNSENFTLGNKIKSFYNRSHEIREIVSLAQLIKA